MKRLLSVLALALLLVPASTFAQSKKSEVPAYLLSVLLGFGTGHMYAESPKAGTFLWSEVGSIAVMTGGVIYSTVSTASAVNSANSGSLTSVSDATTGAMTGLLITSVGSIAFGVFRIWEIVDIFGTVDQQKKAGILASAQPEISVQPKGVSFTLGYHY